MTGRKVRSIIYNMTTIKQYESGLDFLEFLNEEFNKTAVNATVEELAMFAFGNVDETVKAFMKYKKK